MVMDLVRNPGGLSGEEIAEEGGDAVQVDTFLRKAAILWLRYEVIGEKVK